MLRRVVIVAFDGCQALDVIGPLEVFSGARAAQVRRRAHDPGYAPLVAATTRPVRSESGLEILPKATLAAVALARAPAIDTLIVAGGEGTRAAARSPGRTRACASRRIPIYVRDGKVWTSAGVSAGIDLALAMVEEDLGRDLAMLIARWLVVFVRRAGGQSQFSAQLQAQAAEREPIRELQAFIVEHPEAALDVPALARRAAMSVRHFGRVFRAEAGLSPAAYVERVRIETARRLLESNARSVEEVAAASGFGTPETLRRAFARRVGLSPREYRARFGAPRRGAEA
jgi:transcriptional regulator GlxA family with amidase domain